MIAQQLRRRGRCGSAAAASSPLDLNVTSLLPPRPLHRFPPHERHPLAFHVLHPMQSLCLLRSAEQPFVDLFQFCCNFCILRVYRQLFYRLHRLLFCWIKPLTRLVGPLSPCLRRYADIELRLPIECVFGILIRCCSSCILSHLVASLSCKSPAP